MSIRKQAELATQTQAANLRARQTFKNKKKQAFLVANFSQGLPKNGRGTQNALVVFSKDHDGFGYTLKVGQSQDPLNKLYLELFEKQATRNNPRMHPFIIQIYQILFIIFVSHKPEVRFRFQLDNLVRVLSYVRSYVFYSMYIRNIKCPCVMYKFQFYTHLIYVI